MTPTASAQPVDDARSTARPILVTGAHRSGTTWVGQMLAASGETHVIHEPFNPTLYRTWMSDPAPSWYWHVPVGDDGPFDDVARIVDLRPSTAMFRRARSGRALLGAAREHLHAAGARRRGLRPLLKDPLAFFSAEWLAARFGAGVVVLVRHPAAFVASNKRLGWHFDFRNLVEQPRLMDGVLSAHADEIERASAQPPDLVGAACLQWRLITSTALSYRSRHTDWSVLRYEDVAADPLARFHELFDRLSLSWTPAVAATIERASVRPDSAFVADGDKGGVVRNSRLAMWTWADRLTPAEIDRVRIETSSVAQEIYADEDWSVPDAS